jgi:hypothetical protein
MLYHPAYKQTDTGRTGWYRTGDDDHFYTTNSDERYRAMYQHGYQDYGVACHIWPEQTVYSVVPKIKTTGGSQGNVGSFPPSQQQQAVANDLFKKGCKAFLGRVNQGDFLCSTQAGYDACEVYRNKGQAKVCRRAK